MCSTAFLAKVENDFPKTKSSHPRPTGLSHSSQRPRRRKNCGRFEWNNNVYSLCSMQEIRIRVCLEELRQSDFYWESLAYARATTTSSNRCWRMKVCEKLFIKRDLMVLTLLAIAIARRTCADVSWLRWEPITCADSLNDCDGLTRIPFAGTAINSIHFNYALNHEIKMQ